VANADLADGLLAIDLVREVPEAMKPKKVTLPGQRKLDVVDNEPQSDADEAKAA
jgi:molecular chaperone IbpA